MTWQLLGTVIPVVILLAASIFHVRRSQRRDQERHDESEKLGEVGAKCANDLHKRKYGRSSTDLENAFPSLKVVK